MITTDLALEGGGGPTTIARHLIAEGADPEETLRVTRCGAQCFPDHPLRKWAGDSVPIRETADNYPCVVARLNDDWRVITCRNGIQWVLQRRGDRGSGPAQWKGVSYCQTREALKRVSREAGPIEPAAWEALALLPDHITAGSKSGARRKP